MSKEKELTRLRRLEEEVGGLKERFLVIKAHRCEFSTHSTDYTHGLAICTCGEPAPFLLCYGGGAGRQPHTMMWACDYHKGEQEREHG